MPRAALRRWLIVLALLLPGQALAQLAHTIQSANVRAGPSAVFPLVTWLPAKEPVRVVGCTEGSAWCDVVAGRTRGWIYARYLSDRARNRTVPIVAFDVTMSATSWCDQRPGRAWRALGLVADVVVRRHRPVLVSADAMAAYAIRPMTGAVDLVMRGSG